MVHEDNPPVTSVCFAPNGRYVLAFSMDSCLRLWDYVSGSVKKTYQGHTNKGFSIGGCFGSIDDSGDAAGSRNKNNISNSNSNSNNTNGGGGGGGSNKNAFIAAASEDGDIVLWDVKTKEIVQRIEGVHDGVCFWVDVNGDTMVSCGQDGKIKVMRHQPPEAIMSNGVGVGVVGNSDSTEDEPMVDSDGAAGETPAVNGDEENSGGTPA
jgi:COMPASS component SWD3